MNALYPWSEEQRSSGWSGGEKFVKVDITVVEEEEDDDE